MEIAMMAACGKNREIGKDNSLLWKLPNDLKLFKEYTKGHHIIMGRKTFESFGAKPLPKRTNIVLTRDEDYEKEGVVVANSLDEALEMVENDEKPFIIGGEEIYKTGMEYADILYITWVDGEFPEADTFFPKLEENEWKLTKELFHASDEKNPYDFTFCEYNRQK